MTNRPLRLLPPATNCRPCRVEGIEVRSLQSFRGSSSFQWSFVIDRKWLWVLVPAGCSRD